MTSGDIIDDQDIYNKFSDRITTLANASIVYGTNSYHFSDMPSTLTSQYGGTTSGLSQSSWGNRTGQLIDASDIVDYVVSEATKYSRIRNVSVTRNVTASGGPAPSSSTATGKTHLLAGYGDGSISGWSSFTAPSSTNIQTGQTISATNLVNYYESCRNEYVRMRDYTITASYSVCHNSCHSSCHGSRGRR